MRRKAFSCFAAVLLVGATTILAQNYDISWYKIAGGGGTSSGGGYTLNGTIGQADAGNLGGGVYSLTGGFWGIIATVQTPGSPLLAITATNGSNVTLSWASAFAAFALQQNSNLANTNGWVAVNTNSFPVTLNNGTNSVTLPASGNQFFRLINP